MTPLHVCMLLIISAAVVALHRWRTATPLQQAIVFVAALLSIGVYIVATYQP